MSMIVKTNISALNTLNILNVNSSNLAKSLKKVSSGQKINSAGDDASGYSISEKMRVQILGLNQADRNTQNGHAAMSIAEGGVQRITDIVRTIKAKTIDAANDTNTDEDRAIIQKELDQLVKQIDDISVETTFNGMRLLDGSLGLHDPKENTAPALILRGLSTWWIEHSLDYIEEEFGLTYNTNNGRRNLSVCIDYDTSRTALAWANSSTLTVNLPYYVNLTNPDTDGDGGSGSPNLLDRVICHELTHSVMMSNFPYVVSGWYMEGMAELAHGADDRFIPRAPNVLQAYITDCKNSYGGGTGVDGYYGGGYIALRYFEHQCGNGTIKKMNEYMLANRGVSLDDAINIASEGRFPDQDGLLDAVSQSLTNAPNIDEFYRDCCGIKLSNIDSGSLHGADALGRPDKGLSVYNVIDEGSGAYGRLPTGTSVINGVTIKWPTTYKDANGDDQPIAAGFHGGMVIQSDTKSNRGMNFPLEKIDAGQLGIKNIDVSTQYQANRAIIKADRAVRRATDYVVLVGSYLTRMTESSANLVTAGENTTNAESVIRDSDMAAEMTEYTKHNILAQASQAMLAQANQNASNVLSLLQ